MAASGTPYRAVREGAGLADRSGEGRLSVTGADRHAWLQGLVTNDVGSLAAGRGCYAAWLTPQGRMITDLRLLELGDRVLVDVPAGLAAALVERLDRFVITEDVQVRDVTGEIARLGVHGPAAAVTLAAAMDRLGPAAASGVSAAALAALAEHASVAAPLVPREAAASTLIAAASRDVGEPGFDVYLPVAVAPGLRAALISAGAAEVDHATWEVLRVEAGRPVFGVDMDEGTIPLEAGIEARAVSETKGCYVGQEVLVRVRDRGHGRVARRLVGLMAGDGPTAAAAAVARGDALTAGDREAGRITSAVLSPALGTLALGYVHRDFVEPGTRLEAQHGEVAVPLVVVRLPFLPKQA